MLGGSIIPFLKASRRRNDSSVPFSEQNAKKCSKSCSGGYSRSVLTWENVRNELRAIRDFDILFLSEDQNREEECAAFVFRQLRKQELREIASALASRN